MPSRLKNWWKHFSASPYQKPTYFLVYIVVIWIGLVALFDPPRTVQNQVGPVLITVIALFGLVGGSTGLFSLLAKWWWLERLALVLMWGAAMAYLTTVLLLHIQSDMGSRLMQMGWITIASFVPAIRFLSILHWSYEPPMTRRQER